MRRSTICLFAAILLACHPSAGAESLRSVEVQLDADDGVVQKGSAGTAAARVRLLSSARIDGELPRQRSSEVSDQHLLLVALDQKGQEIHRRLVIDPRLQRYETVDAAGKFQAESSVLVSNARLRIAVPASARSLRLLSPRRRNEGIEWAELGRVELPQ